MPGDQLRDWARTELQEAPKKLLKGLGLRVEGSGDEISGVINTFTGLEVYNKFIPAWLRR